MRRIIVYILFITGFTHSSIATQKPIDSTRVISLSQFVDEMRNAERLYSLVNALVKFNPETDAEFEIAAEDNPKKIRITALVNLKNVTFEGGVNISFSNMVFEENFRMYDCHGVEPYYLYFDYNQFKNGIDMRRNYFNILGFTHNTIYNNVKFIEQRVGKFYIETTVFSPNVPKLEKQENKSIIPPYFFLANSAETNYFIEIRDCDFNYRLPKGFSGHVILRECYFSNFTLLNSNFTVPLDLTDATIINKFEVMNNTFGEGIFTGDLQTPEFNTRITWDQIANQKIKIAYDFIDDGTGNFLYEIYQPYSREGISNKDNYDRLIHTYAKLYGFYKEQGDVLSSRACLVEWKDLETYFFGHLYEEKKEMYDFFKWKMNDFLRIFCDYGTNPVKSMIWSFYVVFGFGLLYFLIPYDYAALMDKSRKLKNIKKQETEELPEMPVTINENTPKKSSLFKRIFGFIYKTLLRIFDSFILSLNLFTSLGFGSIEVRGLLLYIAVIEGFIGWFLLSIFSVSLISQVLQ
ncbi:MAG: hypothetical protein A3H98_00200 [Bacteroidetes bacterium RIFCSPLOWO2_02_FULL_36_8]|nr:MAG: hypothetical protein A3H98_00200 [Bacteroidetes bacterium RIFCSPLOWO2_02_FULL_36_8]OFY70845.1 MAG: hypothetical protein A3G23_12035 [Bacteroidetes bacterium RIFCSPLOWO2_12_FULL_37_12]